MLKWLLGVLVISTSVAHAGDLRVMKTGVGEGTIAGTVTLTTGTATISCGVSGTTLSTACGATGGTGSVTLSVTEGTDSDFVGWGGDCTTQASSTTPLPPCVLDLTSPGMRSVRANFRNTRPARTISNFTPLGIETFLNLNTDIDTAGEFIAALPPEFHENWIMMPRSESLQTGIAESPRVLLISADATRVFTFALQESDSYPAAHRHAIEYMQYIGAPDYNFHFHEIVLRDIPAMGDDVDPDPVRVVLRHAPRSRGTDPVKEDDARCFNCHSTRNVQHRGGTTPEANTPGTTGIPHGTVKFKTRPNWDTYDSWGGMLGFNRDRIYKGTVEAAAFRKLLNLWTWQTNDWARGVIEQLKLQPDGVPASDEIKRWETAPLAGGDLDGHIQFAFDPAPPTIEREPQPSGNGPLIAYSFDRRTGATGSMVKREATEEFVILRHPCQILALDDPSGLGTDEGRAVEFFDRLSNGAPSGSDQNFASAACPRPTGGGRPNPDRIADELVDTPPVLAHPVATGNVPIDVKPIALAIASGCISVTTAGDVQSVSGVTSSLAFFTARNGMDFNGVYDDTKRRAQSLPRRKADIVRSNLIRGANDLYTWDLTPATPEVVDGLIAEFGGETLGIGSAGGTDQSVERVRQEVFRRSINSGGHPDETVMGRVYNDRENDGTDGTGDNTAPVALYRYFLEPLGVSVDKWSMGVRGRSRTYTFADLFSGYTSAIQQRLATALSVSPTDCTTIMGLVNAQIGGLTDTVDAPIIPTYTDMQRIWNKACIECHGGLGYPPFQRYASRVFDLTEDPNPPSGSRRLWRSVDAARLRTGASTCPAGTDVCTLITGTVDPTTTLLYGKITDRGNLAHPYNPIGNFNATNPDMAPVDPADERCPGGLMPCEGPPLSKVDIESVRRWVVGGHPHTEGDPHIATVSGQHYDFQGAGEFVLLRGENVELQARQVPVTTASPVGPDQHTGLTSCVSLNTAVALRVGLDRVTYQPDLGGSLVVSGRDGDLTHGSAKLPGQTKRLRLRVNGKDVDPGPVGSDGFPLPSGGRIVRTNADDGIEIHVPGGEAIVITPAWWDWYQVWYMNLEVRHARSTEGVMGTILPNNWLPALADGTLLGVPPTDLGVRYRDLYETFASSWRVDATTSLFDYEPGLSPQTFVLDKWPGAGAQQCVAPPMPGGAAIKAAQAPIAQAEAASLCQGLADAQRRDNCIADVMATGERGFARTYAVTEALERRVMPGPATLQTPDDNAFVPAGPVNFKWQTLPGAAGIDVFYRHCVWRGDVNFDFNRCVKLPGGSGGGPGGGVIGRVKERLGMLLWLLLLLLVLIAVFLIRRFRGKGVLAVLLLLALAVALLLLLVRARAAKPPQTTYVADVVPGQEYSWKVIAETRDGVMVESHTYRFEVTP